MAVLRERLGGDVDFIGVGGPRMIAEGLVSLFDIDGLSVLGVSDALRVFPLVLRRARQVAELARRTTPEAAILIDAWGFNLRVAQRLHRLPRRPLIIKYIAPQVWATRPGRARTLARWVDRLLTIHAFDSAIFERHGLKVDFVGNPALVWRPAAGDTVDPSRAGAEPSVLVLPGSRPAEVQRLMPVFGVALGRLGAERRRLRVTLAPAQATSAAVKRAAAEWPFEVEYADSDVARWRAMRSATVALACSGTVTTELASAGCPMVVAYRLSPLTFTVAKRLIRTPFITLLNVAARAAIAPEFVQGDCSAANLAGALAARLDDPGLRARQVAAQTRALGLMRGGIDDPIAAAAEAVIAALTARGADQPRVSIGE